MCQKVIESAFKRFELCAANSGTQVECLYWNSSLSLHVFIFILSNLSWYLFCCTCIYLLVYIVVIFCLIVEITCNCLINIIVNDRKT
jgi:hypothetical protein